jgi:sucrose phosphorylase
VFELVTDVVLCLANLLRPKSLRANLKDQVEPITSVDHLSGGLSELRAPLKGALGRLFGSEHLLPFFNPIEGADAGFDPIDPRGVDTCIGTRENVRTLSEEFELMAGLIRMNRRRPQWPFTNVRLESGERQDRWTTFAAQPIDIHVDVAIRIAH